VSIKNKLQYFLQRLDNDFSIIEIDNFIDEISRIFPELTSEASVGSLSNEERELTERLLVRSFFKLDNVYN